MNDSPYTGIDSNEWASITNDLLDKHPLKREEIVQIVLKSWKDIFVSKIGSLKIGKEIFPSPQIMSFILHELVAHNIGMKYPGIYKVGSLKGEKDVHCITDSSLSVEIKASSNPKNIFANRSYAQPDSTEGGIKKNKDGYYITINFEKFDKSNNKKPEINLIRFGFLEHTDWIPQKSPKGQQARLRTETYVHKFQIIYFKGKTVQE